VALSIKTEEADRLARELSRLTGETMTEAVTVALRERLDRAAADRAAREAELDRLLAEFRANTDLRPISEEEWEWAGGEADFPPTAQPQAKRLG